MLVFGGRHLRSGAGPLAPGASLAAAPLVSACVLSTVSGGAVGDWILGEGVSAVSCGAFLAAGSFAVSCGAVRIAVGFGILAGGVGLPVRRVPTPGALTPPRGLSPWFDSRRLARIPYLRLVTHFSFCIVVPDQKMVTKRP